MLSNLVSKFETDFAHHKPQLSLLLSVFLGEEKRHMFLAFGEVLSFNFDQD